MALSRRAARGSSAAVKLDGTRRAMALLAGCNIGPGLGAMQRRIGKWYGMGRTRTAGMTAGCRTVGVGIAG